MSHIFISYNQDDADFAAVLMMHLEKAGFDTWLDKDRLRPGSDWSEEIDRGILTASAVILVMSPSSRTSEYVTYEWSCALGAGIRVVPLLRRETEIHPRLRRLQYLDFRGSVRPWDGLIRELQSIKDESQSYWRPPRDTPPHLRRAITDLDSANSDDRRGAMCAIAQSDHAVAHLALQHALKSPFNDVRAFSAVVLGEKEDPIIATEEAMNALVEALTMDEKLDHLPSMAKRILLRIGHPSFDYLARASKSKTYTARGGAIDLSIDIGGTQAIPLLIELLEDANANVAVYAIRKLSELRATEAIPRIMQVMTADPEKTSVRVSHSVLHEAKEALIAIGDRSIEQQLIAATKHRLARVRVYAAEALGGLFGETAIPVLANLLSDTDKHVAQVAIDILDKIPTPDAIDLVRKYREYPLEPDRWLSMDKET
jgi:HEAT repeat protein